jgi:eukaryotic-like serine/threonine-protein kinase
MADDAELDAVLDEALALSLEARPAWLDARCGHDTPIRAAVERILREAEAPAPFLAPGGALDGAFGDSLRNELAAEEGLAVGDAVGPYRLVEEIGRGGMAVVYRAERADGAFTQQVALKVVKRGVDTDDVLGRFRQERQILASLTHAHIARLLDGGVTADGRPYLAMELVHGEPLDRYCAARGLGLDARLDLCIAIAEAVQHAHQRLVVHRDLKPSNILITDTGEIRLLDFGIAKLLDPSADGEATATRTALRLLTPDYASPEQVRGDTITTASDVYQLGLILFELVTGRRAQPVAGLGPAEAERAICAHELPRASQALADGAPYPGASKRRLRGDVDRIVATAVAKTPERRYHSVSALADDLRRFRRGLPVAARGDSLWYRTTTFVRRHRVAVAAAAAMVLAVGGIVGFYSWRLAAERDRARQEAATANEAVTFLTGLFTAADPVRPTGTPVTARELLDRGAARVRTDLAAQPELQARMLAVIGDIYRSLSLYGQAVPLLQQALVLRRAQFGANHFEIARSAHQLALALHSAGQSDVALPLYEEALRILESLPAPPADDLSSTLNGLGLVHRRAGRLDLALSFLERAVGVRERAFGHDAAPLAATLNNLGLLYTTQRRLPQARTALERAVAIHTRHRGPKHPLVASSLSNLAEVIRQQGDLEGARVLHVQALGIAVEAFGPAHLSTAILTNAYGRLLYDMRRYDEATAEFERAVAIYERSVGISHPAAPFPIENLGRIHRERGDHAAALRYFERALALREAAHGPIHPEVAQSQLNIGFLLLDMRGCAAALPWLRRGLEVTAAAKASTPTRVSQAQAGIARCEAAPAGPAAAR